MNPSQRISCYVACAVLLLPLSLALPSCSSLDGPFCVIVNGVDPPKGHSALNLAMMERPLISSAGSPGAAALQMLMASLLAGPSASAPDPDRAAVAAKMTEMLSANFEHVANQMKLKQAGNSDAEFVGGSATIIERTADGTTVAFSLASPDEHDMDMERSTELTDRRAGTVTSDSLSDERHSVLPGIGHSIKDVPEGEEVTLTISNMDDLNNPALEAALRAAITRMLERKMQHENEAYALPARKSLDDESNAASTDQHNKELEQDSDTASPLRQKRRRRPSAKGDKPKWWVEDLRSPAATDDAAGATARRRPEAGGSFKDDEDDSEPGHRQRR